MMYKIIIVPFKIKDLVVFNLPKGKSLYYLIKQQSYFLEGEQRLLTLFVNNTFI